MWPRNIHSCHQNSKSNLSLKNCLFDDDFGKLSVRYSQKGLFVFSFNAVVLTVVVYTQP